MMIPCVCSMLDINEVPYFTIVCYVIGFFLSLANGQFLQGNPAFEQQQQAT